MVLRYQELLNISESFENRTDIIDMSNNDRFVENLLRSDFDLTKIDYPTLNETDVSKRTSLRLNRV